MSQHVVFSSSHPLWPAEWLAQLGRFVVPGTAQVSALIADTDVPATPVHVAHLLEIGEPTETFFDGIESLDDSVTVVAGFEKPSDLPASARFVQLPVPTGDADTEENCEEAVETLFPTFCEIAKLVPVEPAVAVIGGSGFYELPGLTELNSIEVETPFGPTSPGMAMGMLAGRRVVFLARHGSEHTYLPSQVNYQANIWALKSLGVTKIISASATGSLKEEIAPGHVCFPRQFIDRTRFRDNTFFGSGLVVHASMADPVSNELSDMLLEAANAEGASTHADGTYVCMEGPQFSTRAESHMYRSWGASVIGMTAVPEAHLAREAELDYATMAFATDYDCWHESEDDVSVDDVMAVLKANVQMAKQVLARSIETLDPSKEGSATNALDMAVLTPIEAVSADTKIRLFPLLRRRFGF